MYSIPFYLALFCVVADLVFGFSFLTTEEHTNDDSGPLKYENDSLLHSFEVLESGIESVVSEVADATNGSQPFPQSVNDLCADLVDKYDKVDRKDADEGCAFRVEVNPMNGNREVNVTLYSGANATFNEFKVQPRHSSDHKELVPGDFTGVIESQSIACFTDNENTLVQNSSDPKSYVNAVWKPRSNVAFLQIIFDATVYVDGDVIYERIISEEIAVTSGPGMHRK